MKSLLKDIFFTLMRFPLTRNRAVILMYHSISGRTDYFAHVTPAEFERQMAYLAEKHIDVIPLAELVRRLKTGESLNGSVAITFDDGYRDNYTVVFPVLKKRRFSATIFVTTDLVGQKDKHGFERLTVAEVQEMEASKLITIEPHTRSHPRLAKLSRDEARKEIAGSKEAVEKMSGKTATLFAYPYGDFSGETARLVQECGLECAVTVKEGTVSRESDVFQLPRCSVDSTTTFSQFKGKITRATDLYELCKI